MILAEIAKEIHDSDLFTAVRQSQYFYPVVLSTHLTCIAIFGGMILATNLRLLGWAFPTAPAGELIRTLRPWKHAGLTLMVTCGILLAGAKADAYYPNTFFRLKMFLLFLLIIHSFVFRSVYRDTTALDSANPIPPKAKLAAALSLLLWLAVVCAGRWIAYYDSPKAIF